jgi:hypothetical protein
MEPLQTTCGDMSFTSPPGLTVIVNVRAVPGHECPLYEYPGVTVIVACTGEVPAFTALNDDISPVPDEASPMDVRLFVHV